MRRKRIIVAVVLAMLLVGIPFAWLLPSIFGAIRDQRVMALIRSGNAAGLRDELKRGYDVHSRFMVVSEDCFWRLVKRRVYHETYGEPLIEYAARNGNDATVQQLVLAGAGPDETEGCTYALYWAANKNDVRMTSYLLTVGANPNPVFKDGSPLIEDPNNEACRLVLSWRALCAIGTTAG
jgi:hypothetical protein